jgi:hypothetical protein
MKLSSLVVVGAIAAAACWSAVAGDDPPQKAADETQAAEEGLTQSRETAAPEGDRAEQARTSGQRKQSDAELVMQAQAAGYRIVNKSGTELLCRTEDVLNSRLRKKVRCLTAAEYERERRAAADALADLSRQTKGPVGD